MGKKKRPKVKSLTQRMKDYSSSYGDIPRHDPVERTMHCVGEKLTIKKVENIIKRRKEILKQQSYSCFKMTFYMEPMGSARPRARFAGGFNTIYVPHAKDSRKLVTNLVTDIKNTINIIHTPTYFKMLSYHPMPSNMPIEEQVLFEAGILHPVNKPDNDNILKFYQDILLQEVILDDDLIYKANIEKFFSFLPRVEVFIYYEDKFASKYIYRKIKSRKSFKDLEEYMEASVLI